ncbi:MAG: peptidoglycan editing factor PgeF [Gammaproteobacteria bacterium]|nr:peptidoglycan editing factor PgeF [Gammaproteobacteria bacterium]
MTDKVVDSIPADWPAPQNIRAFTSTRKNGFSSGSYTSLNLAGHVDDEAATVARNRDWLGEYFQLPTPPLWLTQTHSNNIIAADAYQNAALPPEADAAWTATPGLVCAVLTADCLPVFFAGKQGDRVAVAHAGWRGALNGIISESFAALNIPPEECLVWLGPAIGAAAFEVGPEVYQDFTRKSADNLSAFTRKDEQHWLCDIYQLARIELQQQGIESIYGGGLCTYSDEAHFYSFRRDGARSGRMASLIWLDV